MKKLFLCMSLIISNLAIAQKQEGVITFEEKVNMHKRIADESMRAMMPEFRITKSQLFFNATESLYKPIEEDEADDASHGGMKIQIMGASNEFYRNYGTTKKIDYRDFRGKMLLIEDSLKTTAWKILGENKTIKSYNCTKATFFNEERKQNITAWFTSDISCPAGPQTLGTLPGMILEANINDGEVVYSALNIEFRKLKADELKVTKGGKVTSSAEYKKMFDDFMKETGGTGRIIRRN
jgi:GLPGLI family protein